MNSCPSNPLGSWQVLAWAQKIWPTYYPLPRVTILTFRDEKGRVVTESQQKAPNGDDTGTVAYARDNAFLGNLLVSSVVWSGTNWTTPGWQFYSSDHLGSPRLTTDTSAATVETKKYWPYGDEASSTGNAVQRLKFATMERDDETNHFYDHARTHDFNLGRFVSPDIVSGEPEYPQSWNRATYTLGNPVKYVDRTGLMSDTILACPRDETCPQQEEVTVTAAAPPPDLISVGTLDFFVRSASGLFSPLVKIHEAFERGAERDFRSGKNLSGNLSKALAFLTPDSDADAAVMVALFAAPEAEAVRVVFSEGNNHWFRHLAKAGLAKEAVAAIIRADVERQVGLQSVSGWYTGKITLAGREILYRAKPLLDGAINVGTAFFKR